MYEKICKVHGVLAQESIIAEPKKSAKKGYTLRCLECRRIKSRKWKELNPDKHRKSAGRARNEARKLYREGIIDIEPKANIWAREDRKRNPEAYTASSKRFRDKLGSFINVMVISRERGITTEQYQSMLIAQDYKCAICGLNEVKRSRNGTIAQLCLDHNHATGKVRSFLCHSCNLLIGHFKESEALMINAINYLEKHGESCQ